MKNLLNHKDNDDVFITNRKYHKIKYHYKQNMMFDESNHYPNIEGLGIWKLLYIYIESFNNKKYDLFVRKYKRKIKHTRLHCNISYFIDSEFNNYYPYRNFYVINGILKENLNYIRWRRNNNIRIIYSPDYSIKLVLKSNPNIVVHKGYNNYYYCKGFKHVQVTEDKVETIETGFKRNVHPNSHTYKKYIAEKKSKLRKEARELKLAKKQTVYSFIPLKELSKL